MSEFFAILIHNFVDLSRYGVLVMVWAGSLLLVGLAATSFKKHETIMAFSFWVFVGAIVLMFAGTKLPGKKSEHLILPKGMAEEFGYRATCYDTSRHGYKNQRRGYYFSSFSLVYRHDGQFHKSYELDHGCKVAPKKITRLLFGEM